MYSEIHEIFRGTVKRFLTDYVAPNYPQWEEAHEIPREF